MKFYIPASKSLKDKRKIVKSIISRLKNRNISVAEIGGNDLHRYAEVGFSLVSNNKDRVEERFRKIVDYIEDNYEIEISEVVYDLV